MKAVEEYAKEMTREEFDKFTEEKELCPSDMGLNDVSECFNQCDDCWSVALNNIEFKVGVPTLPNESLPIVTKLAELEIQTKKIDEQKKKLKEDLLKAMEKHGVKKWDNDIMTVTYKAPTSRVSMDSTKLKEELPDVYKKYGKKSSVKSSITIKLK